MSLPIHVDNLGVERPLGNIDAPLKFSWPVYGDVPRAPMVPRSKWAELIGPDNTLEDPHLVPIANQSNIGMCNCSATATAIEATRKLRGLPHVELSGGDLYKRICWNGQDSGSTLEDGIRAAMTEGVASVSVVPYLDWRRNYGQAAVEDRKRYRVLEAFLCPTFDHCMSAVLMKFKLITGILWYNNFTPDQDGWLPLRGQGGGGGHAIEGYKGVMRDGRFGIAHQNSWTSRWGRNGLFVIPETHYTGGIGGWWAVAEVVAESGDLPEPQE